jgi:copper chaperone
MTSSSFRVSGMTCDHCIAAVQEELRALPGVSAVVVELVAGGVSTVTVASDAPLDLQDVRSAVDEAGYELVA